MSISRDLPRTVPSCTSILAPEDSYGEHSGPPRRAMSRAVPGRLAVLIAALALLTPGLFTLQALQAAPANAVITDEQLSDGGVLRDLRSYRVAPGLDLTTFSRLEPEGWNEGSVLTADLRTSSLSMDVKDTGKVAARATLDQVMRSGPRGKKAVAAVNGTFFDINNSDAPIFTSVSREGVRMGSPTARPALTVAGTKATIQMLSAGGTLTLPAGTHELAGVNNPSLSADGIGLYTAAWGDHTLNRPVGGPDKLSARIARATVVDGVVTKVSGITPEAGAPDIADGEQVLLGREKGADAIAALAVGDRVDIEVGPSAPIDLGIAGTHQILTDGKVADLGDDSLATSTHPRTAVGVSRDGSQLFVLVNDGRSANSRGTTLPQLAKMLKDMGAHNAVNLDGGGSSAMLARVAGDDGEKVWNTPSDGQLREVPNALVFYSDAPAQKLSDVKLSTLLDRQDAVFPGMGRTVEATALGSNLEPVMATGQFSTEGPLRAEAAVELRTRVVGTEAGRGAVTFRAGGHEDTVRLRVLGEPIALQPSARTLSLPDAKTTRQFTLTGMDADGQRARVESADVKVSSSSGFEVTDDGLGTWTVRGTGKAETGTVTLKHGSLETTVSLTFGTETKKIFDLSDLSAFTTDSARATGQIGAAEGPTTEDGKTSPGVRMTYDFTTSSATRGFYLVAKEPVAVDGSALSFTMDVKGDGTGAWPRLQVRDANGTVTNLDGDMIESKDWQQVRFTVPAGLAQPLTVERLRIMETRPEAQYKGDIVVANLRAVTTPSGKAAPVAPVHDAALLAVGSVQDRPQRIAVMSDAQFVARDPNSQAVEGARRTLREIREARPDLLVINGDFVDEASDADYALAATILAEEWPEDIPYIYVPGNHEIMGGEIANFEKHFGATRTSRDLGRTRVITLNSATGTLHGAGIDQLRELEKSLREVAASDTLTGVTVFFHHPPTDPLPSKSSQLSDQREARAVERLLADFRRESGKSAAVINGHVGVFHGAAVEGVTMLINGNSGKNPAGTPATGGFTGWMMLGISPGAGLVSENPRPEDRVEWLAAQTHPWVDELALTADERLVVGQTGSASARFTQDDREIPVAWPVTAQWGGKHVQVVTGASTQKADAALTDAAAVVRLNPVTGEVTALRPGKATLMVTVNGRTAQKVITVTGPGKAPEDDTTPDPGKPGDDNAGGGNPGDEGDKPGHPGGDDDPAGRLPKDADSGARDPLARTGVEIAPAAGAAVGMMALGLAALHRSRPRL